MNSRTFALDPKPFRGLGMMRGASPGGFRGVGNGAESLSGWFPRARKWSAELLRMVSEGSEMMRGASPMGFRGLGNGARSLSAWFSTPRKRFFNN